MSKTETYEIRVQGRLAKRWSAWFDGMEITTADDGSTLIRGPVADQAALHGLIQRVRDLGLPLLSVTTTQTVEHRQGRPHDHPGLGHRRYGDFTAVGDVRFSAEPGRVTGLLGPNGSGKSTTMRVIVGLTTPSTGSAHVGAGSTDPRASQSEKGDGHGQGGISATRLSQAGVARLCRRARQRGDDADGGGGHHDDEGGESSVDGHRLHCWHGER